MLDLLRLPTVMSRENGALRLHQNLISHESTWQFESFQGTILEKCEHRIDWSRVEDLEKGDECGRVSRRESDYGIPEAKGLSCKKCPQLLAHAPINRTAGTSTLRSYSMQKFRTCAKGFIKTATIFCENTFCE